MELLNYIYQNAQMGRDATFHLIKLAEDVKFRRALETQCGEYQNIFDAADAKLRELHIEPQGPDATSKLSSYIGINMKTIKDRSPSKLAEMMIQGSTMGTTDIARRLNQYPNTSEDVKQLANRLLATERNNIETMKQFL